GDRRLGRHLAKLADETGGERDALAAPATLALPLGLAGDVDAVLALGLRRVLQRLEELVHVGLERVQIAEACDVDRAEEVPDVGPPPVPVTPPAHIGESRAG